VSTTVVVPARDYIIPVFRDRDRTYTTAYATGLLKISATNYLLIKNETLLAEIVVGPYALQTSLDSQPSSPDYLEFLVDETAGYTLTVTGTDNNNVAQTEVLAIGAHTGDPVRYTTTKIFKTVDANGLSLTACNGTLSCVARDMLILQDTSGTSIQAPSLVVPFRDYTIPVPGEARIWTPAFLSPSMWYAASSLTLNDGDTITSIADLSGNGLTRTRAAASAPIYKTNIINGLPVIRSNGTKALDIASATVTIGTIVAVVGNVTYTTAMALDKQATDGKRIMTFYPDGNTIYAGDANEFMGAAAIPTRIDGAATYTFSNGYHVVSQVEASSTPITSTSKAFSMFAGNTVMQGDIAEIIYFPTCLSAANLSLVEKWLGTKYAIVVA